MSFTARVTPSRRGPECGTCAAVARFDDATYADYEEGIAAYRAGECTRADLARAFGFRPKTFDNHWYEHVVPSLIDVA